MFGLFLLRYQSNIKQIKLDLTYALMSCLLMKIALIPVITATIFRNNNPYKNENIVEFRITDGSGKSEILSNQRAQISDGLRLRS